MIGYEEKVISLLQKILEQLDDIELAIRNK